MERIVALVDEINRSDIKPRKFLEESDHSAIPLLRSLLDELLITKEGNVDWDAKYILELENDIFIYPVERDGFGWLIGGLITDKGVVTFG